MQNITTTHFLQYYTAVDFHITLYYCIEKEKQNSFTTSSLFYFSTCVVSWLCAHLRKYRRWCHGYTTKTFLWHQTKIKLTIALFLNIYCMFKWVINVNFWYYWLVSMVNHGNAHSYANKGTNAMGTQLKPSIGIKLK